MLVFSFFTKIKPVIDKEWLNNELAGILYF